MKKQKKQDQDDWGTEMFQVLKKHNVPINSINDLEQALTKSLGKHLEAALKAELDTHLGYSKHEQSDNENARNGFSRKTVKGKFGETEISIPRDRDGSFEPQIVKKHQSNISAIEEKIIFMYAKGISNRDISETIKEIYNIDLDATYISKITDKILPEIDAFHRRSLSETYAMVWIDGIRFSTREEGFNKEKSVYIIMGVNMEGCKEVLGFYIGESESSKYWLSTFNDIRERGVKKILILASDNLPGISDAIKAAFPGTIIQKCIVHQIRNSSKFVSYKDLKSFNEDMKAIYTAPNLKQAETALDDFEEKWKSQYGYAVKSWRSNFDELVAFFNFPPEIRKLIYTTNPIENLNRSIRKFTKNKGSFPNDKSLEKSVYLSLMQATKKWTDKQIQNWGIIYNQLTIVFDL